MRRIIFRCSIVGSIPACHAGDPGSIPGGGAEHYQFVFGEDSDMVWQLRCAVVVLTQGGVVASLCFPYNSPPSSVGRVQGP